jgi:protein-S-isoprenylcysteine O-methyltransferase Ste14
MTQQVYDVAILATVWATYLRVACVLLASLRTLANRRRFVTFKMGWAEIAAAPEPFLLGATTYLLHTSAPAPSGAAFPGMLAAVSGLTLVLAGWVMLLWAIASWPGIFVGHGVVEGHRLVTRGAYGFVRHPVYLGVFLFWLGPALAFASPAALLLGALYVVPAYLLYLRSEEAMLVAAFGEPYRAYQRAVPFLVPRFGPRGRSAQPARA